MGIIDSIGDFLGEVGDSAATPTGFSAILSTAAGFLNQSQQRKQVESQQERADEDRKLQYMLELAKIKDMQAQGGGGGDTRGLQAQIISNSGNQKAQILAQMAGQLGGIYS